jgi:hypothetical protein
VVERVPRGEVASGLPEHVEVLPEVLVAALDDRQGDRAGDDADRQQDLGPGPPAPPVGGCAERGGHGRSKGCSDAGGPSGRTAESCQPSERPARPPATRSRARHTAPVPPRPRAAPAPPAVPRRCRSESTPRPGVRADSGTVPERRTPGRSRAPAARRRTWPRKSMDAVRVGSTIPVSPAISGARVT